MPHSNEQEEELFYEATRLPDLAARRSFLIQACSGDPILLARIEELLSTQPEVDRFFAEAADECNSMETDEPFP